MRQNATWADKGKKTPNLKVQNGSVNIKHREGEEGDALGTGASVTFQSMYKAIPEHRKSGKGREWLK